jgi:fatty acid desaturase
LRFLVVSATGRRELGREGKPAGLGPAPPAMTRTTATTCQEPLLIILGVILLIIGFIAAIPIIWTIGIIVVVIGAILALLGMAGHAVGGRRHYF